MLCAGKKSRYIKLCTSYHVNKLFDIDRMCYDNVHLRTYHVFADKLLLMSRRDKWLSSFNNCILSKTFRSRSFWITLLPSRRPASILLIVMIKRHYGINTRYTSTFLFFTYINYCKPYDVLNRRKVRFSRRRVGHAVIAESRRRRKCLKFKKKVGIKYTYYGVLKQR